MIIKGNSIKEIATEERCFISEVWNAEIDNHVSIAKARVEPGVTTTLHYLDGITERYLITQGKGLVEIGDLPPSEVERGDVVIIPEGISQRIKNIGEKDLIFYCVCAPRFR